MGTQVAINNHEQKFPDLLIHVIASGETGSAVQGGKRQDSDFSVSTVWWL